MRKSLPFKRMRAMKVLPRPEDQGLNLRQAIDQEIMAGLFENYLRQEYPERKLKVDKCQVGYVYHKPEKNFQIIYRLSCEDGKGQKFDQWIFGRIDSRGQDERHSFTNKPEHWPGCGDWKSVTHWAKKRMQVHAFPYDP